MRVIIPIIGLAIAAAVVTRATVEAVVPRRPRWGDLLGGDAP